MRRGSAEDKELVVTILISAFAPLTADNSINLIARHDEKRQTRLKLIMEYLFERALLFGDIFISDNENACILFNYPERIKPSFKSFLMDVKLAFQCIGLNRVQKVLKRRKISQRYLPEGDHIRIVIGGSNAESNGNGAAARLMLEIIKEFKGNTLPVITDASNPDNVRLYQKLGFKQIGKDESLGYPIYYLRLN